MKGIILAMLAATAVLLAAACGDNGGDGVSPTPGASPSPGPSPTRGPVAPPSLCQQGKEPRASYNVHVTARWKGKDRIVIEGSATLPGGGSVNYWVCQDGQVTASLVWAQRPTFKDGDISAESKVVEAKAGPLFDPDASFVVVLQVLGEAIQVPYFTVSVPVEGKPE
jgi:hypothetical protein